MILASHPALPTAGEYKEGRNRGAEVLRNPMQVGKTDKLCAEVQRAWLSSWPTCSQRRFKTWGWGLRLEEWMDDTTRRTRKPPWFEGYSDLEPPECFGEPYKPHSVRRFKGLNLLFLLGAQCLLFEERKQENGSQGSGSNMDTMRRAQIWSQIYMNSSQAICLGVFDLAQNS